MIIIGLDISSSNTGISVFKKNKKRNQLLAYYSIAPVERYAKDRYVKMIDGIREILDEYHPHCIVVENFFLYKSFASIEYIVKIHGYIEYYCYTHACAYARYAPSEWRKILQIELTVKRDQLKEKLTREKILKQRDIDFVKKRFKLVLTDDNIADAICIGYAYLQKIEK